LWMAHPAARPYSSGYGAGYIREDGTYVEKRDCPADQVCDPAPSRPAPRR
jgi:hypothetical protein